MVCAHTVYNNMYNNMFIGLINNPAWVFLFDSLVLRVTNYRSKFFIRLKERGQGRIKETGKEEWKRYTRKNKRKKNVRKNTNIFERNIRKGTSMLSNIKTK